MPVEIRVDRGYSVFLPGNPDEYVPGGVNLHRRLKHPSGARPVLIFPPLGNTGVAIEHIARRLKIPTLTNLKREYGGNQDSILPSPVTDQTKEKGILDSPSMICFPYKVDLGVLLVGLDEFNYVRSQSNGSFYPLILFHASSGYCRERTYSPLLELTLRDSARNPHKDFDFYVVHESLQGTWELVSLLSNLSGRNRFDIVAILNRTIARLDMVEKFEDRIRYAQSLGGNYDSIETVLTEAKQQAAAVDLTNSQLRREFTKHLKQVASFKRDREQPIGIIAIIGEIFHCEEFMGNPTHFLGKKLLEMGLYFRREVGLHHYTPRFRLDPQRLIWWILRQVNPFERDFTRERAAAGGLKHDAGGHSEDNVAFAQLQSKTKEYDGIVEVYPFGCSPSVVDTQIIEKITTSSGTPYLKIQIDEQMGDIGYLTRIEGFADMIIRRKRRLVESSKLIYQ